MDDLRAFQKETRKYLDGLSPKEIAEAFKQAQTNGLQFIMLEYVSRLRDESRREQCRRHIQRAGTLEASRITSSHKI